MNEETRNERVKFEVYGEELLEKTVKPSGGSGRVYLPSVWAGSRVKIVRICGGKTSNGKQKAPLSLEV